MGVHKCRRKGCKVVMLDYFCIFSAGGIMLWHYMPPSGENVIGNPVNKLIRSVLLQDRLDHTSWSDETYTLKWRTNNVHGLYFVGVYRKEYMLGYVDLLLEKVDRKFISTYKDVFTEDLNSSFEFDDTFAKLYDQAEEDTKQAKIKAKTS